MEDGSRSQDELDDLDSRQVISSRMVGGGVRLASGGGLEKGQFLGLSKV